MTDEQLVILQKLASAAKPGPWTAHDGTHYGIVGTGFWWIYPFSESEFALEEVDAKYIAAANPQVVGALIEEILQRRRR